MPLDWTTLGKWVLAEARRRQAATDRATCGANSHLTIRYPDEPATKPSPDTLTDRSAALTVPILRVNGGTKPDAGGRRGRR